MADKKSRSNGRTKAPNGPVAPEFTGTVASTVSGPSSTAVHAAKSLDEALRPIAAGRAAQQEMARAFVFNDNKPREYAIDGGPTAEVGTTLDSPDPAAGASTASEGRATAKLGTGNPPQGVNPLNESLDRVRVDSSDQPLTTNQGVPISDNQHSLKAGLRGPTLLEDFILREKISHFDHERIPERVVHARGSAAHGYFECTTPIPSLTRAVPFSASGKRTPVFLRFSTVAGERGSADTVRDVRGFAVKFYTEQGNWDLVGNNMPVFFIQDAMKFPDLIHAVKPEPHHGIPQASSAHDTFWDFVSLTPESTHMLMWVMSDRALPRSFATMQGFGVHTFRLVNEDGVSSFCKFHFNPVAGTHSLAWDEAVKIAGADGDFHRRDLWERIEAGHFPTYEMAVQVFDEAQAEAFSFDVLDSTKIIPEELVPLQVVGRLVLDRNPDNFFAETEQVAFCTSHVIPGIDFSNDPLLQGRLFSYQDTQLTRLGGPNFHEIPINGAIAPVHNNQRDGLHRQAIPRGRVSYEPNSLGGGCPFQAGAQGFVSFPRSDSGDKVRGKPERFADHFTQARLFYRSQTPVERQHIASAFRFELTRVQTQAIRERMVSILAAVDLELAQEVASGLGFPVPEPHPAWFAAKPEIEVSPPLSLSARPGNGSIGAKRIALLVAAGVSSAGVRAAHAMLAAAGAAPRFVGPRLGSVMVDDGEPLHVEITFETAPSQLWDAVVVADRTGGWETVTDAAQVVDFVRDQFRHCKPILAFGAGQEIARYAVASLSTGNDGRAPGVFLSDVAGSSDPMLEQFVTAVGAPRDLSREKMWQGG
ncbi:MAG: catalase [Proteobacteria bacterium]|nr:catalase [Burkholderiales bacterium]